MNDDTLDSRLRNILAVPDDVALCSFPRHGDIQSLIDHQHPVHAYIINSVLTNMTENQSTFANRNEYLSPDNINAETLKTALIDFAAGVQFAFEKASWGDEKIKFKLESFPFSPEYNNAKTGGPDAEGEYVIQLGEGMLSHFCCGKKLMTEESKYRFGKTFDRGSAAFLAGVEEGRHLSQELVSDLETFADVNDFNEAQSQPLPDEEKLHDIHNHDLQAQEIEAKKFIMAHADEIKHRINEVNKANKASGRSK